MPRNKTYADVAKAIGDTPMIQINRLVPSVVLPYLRNASFFNRSTASKTVLAWR